MYDFIEFEMTDYFPMDKVDWNSGSHDQYLFDLYKTINDNKENGNYQVSNFYSHLVFMCYVYYCIELAYQLNPKRVEDIFYPINAYYGKSDKPKLKEYKTVYDFSKIPEKEIFKVFYVIGMDDQKIKALAKYISSRDDFAHATGKGNISFIEYDNNIISIKGNMSELHKLFRKYIKTQYKDFLINSYSHDYNKLEEEFEEYLFENSFSMVDLQYMCLLGISDIRNKDEKFKTNYRYIIKIHCAFIEYCADNHNLLEPDNFSHFINEDYLYFKYKNRAVEYIGNELRISHYECVKDGDEFPLYECLECGAEQLVHEMEKRKYHCFECDTEFSECGICGALKIKSEQPFCDNCKEDVMIE